MTEHQPQGHKPEESDRADESIRAKVSATDIADIKCHEFHSRNRIEDIRLNEAEANLYRRLSQDERVRLAEHIVIRDKILEHQDVDWTDQKGGSE